MAGVTSVTVIECGAKVVGEGGVARTIARDAEMFLLSSGRWVELCEALAKLDDAELVLSVGRDVDAREVMIEVHGWERVRWHSKGW